MSPSLKDPLVALLVEWVGSLVGSSSREGDSTKSVNWGRMKGNLCNNIHGRTSLQQVLGPRGIASLFRL